MKRVSGKISFLFLCLLMSACSSQGILPETSPTMTEVELAGSATSHFTPSPTALLVEDNAQERLIIWGRNEEGLNGECQIWLLDPANQSEPMYRVTGKQDCNYAVVAINGKEYLASLPHWNPNVVERPAEIVLYEMTSDGELVVHQTIPMGDVRLTSLTNMSQWAADGSVYLAGILDGKEQIFRYDGRTATIEPYLDAADGFSTGPLLSPDSRYLAYQVVESRESSDQCDRQDCFLRFFHVWDIRSGEDIELLPLIEPWLAGEP